MSNATNAKSHFEHAEADANNNQMNNAVAQLAAGLQEMAKAMQKMQRQIDSMENDIRGIR